MTKSIIYLDHAATTRVYPEVIAEFTSDLAINFANPASSHKMGNELKLRLDEIKNNLLNVLKATPDDHFFFTSSATESNNTVISGLTLKVGDVVLYSNADHPSVVSPIEKLKEKGVEILSLKLLSNGAIDLTYLEEIFSQKSIALAVFSHVNHQSGNIYDIKKLASLVKKYSPKAHVHIDAVQAFGKIECTVTNDIDSISIAAHKFGGPKGIAGLYLKKNHRVLPMLLGGRQQGGFRPGTENFPLTNAFFKATKITLLNQAKNFENIDQFNKLIKEAIKEFIPTSQFPFEETSPYILTFIVPGISSDIILRHLEVKNIFVGTTSACSAKIKAYNPTLAALKIPEKCHKNILRISFGSTSNQADIELFLKEFKAVWSELRHFLK